MATIAEQCALWRARPVAQRYAWRRRAEQEQALRVELDHLREAIGELREVLACNRRGANHGHAAAL